MACPGSDDDACRRQLCISWHSCILRDRRSGRIFCRGSPVVPPPSKRAGTRCLIGIYQLLPVYLPVSVPLLFRMVSPDLSKSRIQAARLQCLPPVTCPVLKNPFDDACVTSDLFPYYGMDCELIHGNSPQQVSENRVNKPGATKALAIEA